MACALFADLRQIVKKHDSLFSTACTLFSTRKMQYLQRPQYLADSLPKTPGGGGAYFSEIPKFVLAPPYHRCGQISPRMVILGISAPE
jgi:hypothetical protein